MYDVSEPPRPQGAPEKGSTIWFEPVFGNPVKGTVIGYFSTQFLIEIGPGHTRVVGVNETWKLIKQNTE